MPAIKIEFKIKCDVLPDGVIEDIYWYLACLYKNGQIFSDYELIKDKVSYFTIVLSPEENSLKKNNNYVKEIFEGLQQWFDITYQTVGECADFVGSCNCRDQKEFVLHRRYGFEESPVKCADCGKSVPLYMLPYIMDEQEHFTVLQWQKAYTATEKLWMIGLNENLMERELCSLSSELSVLGKQICKEFEKHTSKNFYYYIQQENGNRNDVCANCGKRTRKKGAYFLCDLCRLAMS